MKGGFAVGCSEKETCQGSLGFETVKKRYDVHLRDGNAGIMFGSS